MSYYQEGYDKGYADGRAGKISSQEWPYALLDILNTKEQQEYENGYDAGYEDGKEVRAQEGEEE